MQHLASSDWSPPPVYESADLILRAEERKQAGNELVKSKEYAEAVKVYSEAIQLHPKGSAYWLNRSTAQRHLENWEAAASDATMAAELDPTNPKVHYILALCYNKLRQYRQALEACEIGLMLQADNKALLQLQLEIVRVKKQADVKEGKLAQMASLFSRPDEPKAPSRGSTSSESSSSDGYMAQYRPAKKEPRSLTEADAPYQELCTAAAIGDLDTCTRLLETGQIHDLSWKLPEDGNTALHIAADASHEAIVRALLAAEADPGATNDYGLNPFCLADRGTEVYRLLLQTTRRKVDRRRNARKTRGAMPVNPAGAAADWTRFDV